MKMWLFKSSHRKCSAKKDVLKNFLKFHRKTPVLESLFNKVAGLCNFIKKRLQYRCFPVKIVKFSRTPISKNTCERLLLAIHRQNLLVLKIKSCKHKTNQ